MDLDPQRRRQTWRAPPLRRIAHRGGSLEAPENTLLAFAHARRTGADAIELDVRLSADGVPVLCHDATVERTTDGRGAVADLTARELAALDAAHWFVPGAGAQRDAGHHPLRGTGAGVPTLEQALEATTGTPLVVEVKVADEALTTALVAVLDRHDRGADVLLASFHDEPLAALRARGLPTSASQSELTAFWVAAHDPDAALPSLDAVALQVPLRYDGADVVTPALVAAARARDLALHVWTVDEPADVRRLRDTGVDGIITDRPEALAQER